MGSAEAWVLDQLFALPSVRPARAALPWELLLLTELRLFLPTTHLRLLERANGLTAYGGYVRVLGVADLDEWNAPGTWKVAWPEAVLDYLCFGGTGFGDQYAYHRKDLLPDANPPVYFLDALAMRPKRVADSFLDFASGELLAICHEPYDQLLVEVRKRLGDLAYDEHVIHVPSPLISGSESLDQVIKMDAVTAMIANGDVASQLIEEPGTKEIERLEPYTDGFGRTRLRIVWR